MIMFGSAYVFGVREHLTIDLIRDKFNPTVEMIVEIASNICLAGFILLVCVYGGWRYTQGQAVQVDPSLLVSKAVLYITKGTKEVTFGSNDASAPARFYVVSAPAHKVCKTTFISIADANKRPLGDVKTANKRVINQSIHPDVLETCQLSMGLTKLEEGSVWNSVPPHTHERRMEIYTYYNIPDDGIVLHLMGQPQETRHLVMQNFDAVISPSWSIHAGCGSSNYTFIWAMGGENQAFDDMDTFNINEMR
ncbi:MAG: 5-dehydro-4-deoxy-D-glucuronate isomerase [Oscillospiraceae bacterium]|nr:5-dehydro-4-deoxy-D-glucuronate isomerase [Oscillospiraceae bacterium]